MNPWRVSTLANGSSCRCSVTRILIVVRPAIIAYAIDHLNLDLERANRFNKYRKLRDDIAYRGDAATEHEAEQVRELFKQLREELGPDLEERLS